MCYVLILNCCDTLGLEDAVKAIRLCPELPTCLSTTRQPVSGVDGTQHARL